MGHLARLFEDAGIATVIIGIRAFMDRLIGMTVPRALVTPYPMGRTLGAPNRPEMQRLALLAGLKLLERAERVGTIEELSGEYRAGRLMRA